MITATAFILTRKIEAESLDTSFTCRGELHTQRPKETGEVFLWSGDGKRKQHSDGIAKS